MADAVARVEAGEEDPACLACGGIIKAATVSFGQNIPPEVWARAEALTASLRRVRGRRLLAGRAARRRPARQGQPAGAGW